MFWSIPAALIRAGIGPEHASILLKGRNIVPKRTLAMGYEFHYPTIEGAMDDLVEITF